MPARIASPSPEETAPAHALDDTLHALVNMQGLGGTAAPATGPAPEAMDKAPWEADDGEAYFNPLQTYVHDSQGDAPRRSGMDDTEAAFPYHQDSQGHAPRHSSPRSHKFSDSVGSNLSSYTASSSVNSLPHSHNSLSHSHNSSLSSTGDAMPWNSVSDPIEIPKPAPANGSMFPHQAQLPHRPQLPHQSSFQHRHHSPHEPRSPRQSRLPDETHSPHQSRSPYQSRSPHQSSFPRRHQSLKAEVSDDDDEVGEQDDNVDKKTKLGLAPRDVLEDLDSPPRCFFVKYCTTNSQLRKAISHVFGRNKICTRQIPDNIWVHFCRKHYQRCRYRNALDYARLQCQLVVVQINRVQAWSDRNKDQNRLGVVTGWTLGLRKREQRRMASLKDAPGTPPPQPPSNKRPHPGFQDPTASEPVPPADPPASQPITRAAPYKPPHAVPDWLLAKVGKEFTTKEVIELFQEIEKQMDQGILTEIPDIEILPTITHDPNEEVQYKRYEKRKLYDHKTGQTRHSNHSAAPWNPGGSREMSRYNGPATDRGAFWDAPETSGGGGGYPFGKRQRVGDLNEELLSHGFPPRSEDRIVPEWKPSPSSLPHPASQMSGALPTAQQLEVANFPSGYNDHQRRPHERSHSDTSAFRHLPPVAQQPPRNRFTSVNGVSLPAPSLGHRPSASYSHPEPSRGVTYGTGTNGNSYSGYTYGGSSSSFDHQPSFTDYPPRYPHPSFTSNAASGPSSYYNNPEPAAAPSSPSSSPFFFDRSHHVRHQSSPPISESPRMHGNTTGFSSSVVPEGYPPSNNYNSNDSNNSNNGSNSYNNNYNNNNNNNNNSSSNSQAYYQGRQQQQRFGPNGQSARDD